MYAVSINTFGIRILKGPSFSKSFFIQSSGRNPKPTISSRSSIKSLPRRNNNFPRNSIIRYLLSDRINLITDSKSLYPFQRIFEIQPIHTSETPNHSQISEIIMTIQHGTINPASNSLRKPVILCLHGGGTNKTIFNIQTIRLQRTLSASFEFLFIDAPFEAPAGPGVIPVFEGCGPFFRWTAPGRDDMPEETRKVISNVLSDKDRNFVGILGFSQGAKCAAGLLLEQQLRNKRGEQDDPKRPGFKFGIFLNGVYPPLTSKLSLEEMGELIRIPSIHIIGTEDPFREESRALFQDSFDKRTARKYEFDLGHRLPTAEKDTAKVVGEISRLYRETSGRLR